MDSLLKIIYAVPSSLYLSLFAYCAAVLLFSTWQRYRYADNLSKPEADRRTLREPFQFSFVISSMASTFLFLGLAAGSKSQAYPDMIIYDLAKIAFPCCSLMVYAMQIVNWLYSLNHPHNVDPLVPKLSAMGRTNIADVIVIGILVVIVYRTIVPVLDALAGWLITIMLGIALLVAILVFDLFGWKLSSNKIPILPNPKESIDVK